MTEVLRRNVEIILDNAKEPDVLEAALRIQLQILKLEAAGFPRVLPSDEPTLPYDTLPLLKASQQYIQTLKPEWSLRYRVPELEILQNYGLTNRLAHILYRADKDGLTYCTINNLITLAQTPLAEIKKSDQFRQFGPGLLSQLQTALGRFAAAYYQGDLEGTVENKEVEEN